ncbi:hypothetical protein GCM10022254_56270 [Actinomadura meridiana]|uniref:Uncharacterized protein n=1 Tax=Actinomadura meridiana TaxID=559626 RepID=A0ABP8CFY5_9ACTN
MTSTPQDIQQQLARLREGFPGWVFVDGVLQIEAQLDAEDTARAVATVPAERYTR